MWFDVHTQSSDPMNRLGINYIGNKNIMQLISQLAIHLALCFCNPPLHSNIEKLYFCYRAACYHSTDFHALCHVQHTVCIHKLECTVHA